MKTKWPLAEGLAAIALGVFWFVWPTPYEYTRKAPDVYRVHRFTGVREVATATGWMLERDLHEHRAKEQEEARTKAEADRQAEKERLSEPIDLAELNLGGSTANGRISFVDDRLLYDITLSYEGKLKKAYNGGYRSIYYLNLNLRDDNGFTCERKRIMLSEFVGSHVGQKVQNLTCDGFIPMSVDRYKRIKSWWPVYNWGG